MKTTFASFAAVLVTLCTVSTALAETPVATTAPIPFDVPQIAVCDMPQFYYSETRYEQTSPSIIIPADDADIEEGKTVGFGIQFDGYPLPTVDVFYNRKPINFSKTTPSNALKYTLTCNGGHAVLIVYEIEAMDAGEYLFEVTNRLGRVYTYATLNVITD